MQRKSITNFEYIALLVDRIQHAAYTDEATDFYFEELEQIYSSLLKAATYNIVKQSRSRNLTYKDVLNLVRGIFYKIILRYNSEFTNSKNKTGFTTVYFSNYLKRTMDWEVYRLLHPIKPESDDLEKSLHHVDLHPLIHSDSTELEDIQTPTGVTQNFINLCNFIRIRLKSDLHADIMFLLYGYSLKFNEVSKLLDIPAAKISKINNEIKSFWFENKDQLRSD